MAWELIYEYKNGKSPVEDFIKSLNSKSIARVIKTIDLLETYGNMLRMPHSKKLTGDIFELRIKRMESIRILYAFGRNKVIYLLHGFKKKTQKTPLKEIRLAEDRLKKYLT